MNIEVTLRCFCGSLESRNAIEALLKFLELFTCFWNLPTFKIMIFLISYVNFQANFFPEVFNFDQAGWFFIRKFATSSHAVLQVLSCIRSFFKQGKFFNFRSFLLLLLFTVMFSNLRSTDRLRRVV